MEPLFKALHDLGGSGTIEEIDQKTAELSGLSEDVLSIPHDPEKSGKTEFEYRVAWARTYLKIYGIIDNSARGVWSIVPEKMHIQTIDPDEVWEEVKKIRRKKKQSKKIKSSDEDDPEVDPPNEFDTWRSELHHLLINELSPDAFERLTKRILRESGFTQVEVTGRVGDRGIDGNGILRMGGLLSFHVVFQCKKYQGSVSSSDIRDFRGSMIGRADKGLFITTGNFTREAVREATRDGAPAIDLIDGDQLADKLKELGLGIKKEMVEKVTVDQDWFKKI